MIHRPLWLACTAGALFLGVWGARAQVQPPPLLPPQFQNQAEQDDDGVEVLTRGQVHEAFAQPVVYDPKPGIVVPKKPPEPVEELPPDQKPEGDTVGWMPGYWAWDTDRNDFIWISGFWRNIPPGRQWVPGYWNQVRDGFQWVSGFWASVERQQVEYLPPPPPTLDNGPPSAAPSDDQVWSPGYWYYYETRYVWRPGFWIGYRPNWVWNPARYYWTPGGHVFTSGYWDYAPVQRGFLFAPVYYSRPIYVRPGYRYTPGVVINVNLALQNFFVGPRYGSYFFGNYYDSVYVSAGYLPWYSFRGRYGWDPFVPYYGMAWYGSNYRYSARNTVWINDIQQNYVMRQKNPALRPPSTFRQQQALATAQPAPGKLPPGAAPNAGAAAARVGLAQPLALSQAQSPTKFQKLTAEQRQQIGQQAQSVRKGGAERNQFEGQTAAKAGTGAAKGGQPLRGTLPKTHLSATTRAGAPSAPEATPQKGVPPVAPKVGMPPKTAGQNVPPVTPKGPGVAPKAPPAKAPDLTPTTPPVGKTPPAPKTPVPPSVVPPKGLSPQPKGSDVKSPPKQPGLPSVPNLPGVPPAPKVTPPRATPNVPSTPQVRPPSPQGAPMPPAIAPPRPMPPPQVAPPRPPVPTPPQQVAPPRPAPQNLAPPRPAAPPPQSVAPPRPAPPAAAPPRPAPPSAAPARPAAPPAAPANRPGPPGKDKGPNR